LKLGAINDDGKSLVFEDLDPGHWQETVDQVAEEHGWTDYCPGFFVMVRPKTRSTAVSVLSCHLRVTPGGTGFTNQGAGDQRELSTQLPYRIDAGTEPVQLVFEADPHVQHALAMGRRFGSNVVTIRARVELGTGKFVDSPQAFSFHLRPKAT
jgi:hypothetical protein